MGREKGYYAYGIIESSEPRTFKFVCSGVEEEEAYTINYSDLALVVGDASSGPYVPNQENLRRHNRVLTWLMQEHTIIPISFGAVFFSKEEALELLASTYAEIKQTLVRLHNKVELGLKVMWKKDVLAAELENRYEDLREYKARIATLPPDQVFQATIRLGQMVEAAMREVNDAYLQEIYEPLAELAAESCLNRLLHERMVLNAAFLVPKQREPEFDARVDELYERYQGKFDFKYSGPWPPYNFVKIAVGNLLGGRGK